MMSERKLAERLILREFRHVIDFLMHNAGLIVRWNSHEKNHHGLCSTKMVHAHFMLCIVYSIEFKIVLKVYYVQK
jgi:hypothetical protein